MAPPRSLAPDKFPVSSQQIRDLDPETGSHQTACTAILSAFTETYDARARVGPQTPWFRGVLGAGRGESEAGDCGLRDWKTPQSVFVSVATFGGSVSPWIRPSEVRRSTDLPASPSEPDGERSRGAERVCI
jgi:hypothetical protein